MSYGVSPQSGAIIEELVSIGYLCGYAGEPSLGKAPEIIKRCLSHGPYGWGLALLIVKAILHAGETPYFTVNPIPFGYVSKIRGVWIIDPEVLQEYRLIEEEGFYLVREEETHTIRIEDNPPVDYKVYKPKAFGIVIAYCQDDCGSSSEDIAWRCFLVQETSHPTYPWISIIPTDKTCKKMIDLVKSDKNSLTNQEQIDWIMKYGLKVERSKTFHEILESEEEAEEEMITEFEDTGEIEEEEIEL